MIGSLAILLIIPVLDRGRLRSSNFRPGMKILIGIFLQSFTLYLSSVQNTLKNLSLCQVKLQQLYILVNSLFLFHLLLCQKEYYYNYIPLLTLQLKANRVYPVSPILKGIILRSRVESCQYQMISYYLRVLSRDKRSGYTLQGA